MPPHLTAGSYVPESYTQYDGHQDRAEFDAVVHTNSFSSNELALFLIVGWAVITLASQTVWRRQLALYGIYFGLFGVKVRTTLLNRPLIRVVGLLGRWWLRTWFALGAIFGICAMVAGFVMLLLLLASTHVGQHHMPRPQAAQISETSETDTLDPDERNFAGAELVPVIPGLTVPLSHAFYLFITLLINGVLHEAGHALAAISENVSVEGSGMVLMIGYPGAFVELNSFQLSSRRPMQQLRIYTAGVWHNMVLTIAGVCMIQMLPTVLSPWYHFKSGIVSVESVQPGSPLSNDLFPGDIISELGSDCKITSAAKWSDCIDDTNTKFSENFTGFCLPLEIVRLARSTNSIDTQDCCQDDNTHDIDTKESRLCYRSKSVNTSVMCAGVRRVFTESSGRCRSDGDCPSPQQCFEHIDEDINGRLIQIVVPNAKPILFLGNPNELAYDITVSDFVAIKHEKIFADKMHHRSHVDSHSIFWPGPVMQMLSYFVSISAALSVLNIVPVFYFDGEFAVSVVLQSLGLSTSHAATMTKALCSIGSLLLALNIVIAFLPWLE